MPCPKCRSHKTRVVDSRWRPDFKAIYRRRICDRCERRWSTFEYQAESEPDAEVMAKLVGEMEWKMAEALKEFRDSIKGCW